MTIRQFAETTDNFTSRTSANVTSVSWEKGDTIVVVCGTATTDSTLNAPTNANLTFEARINNNAGADECEAACWTAVATSAESNQTIVVNVSTSDWIHGAVWVTPLHFRSVSESFAESTTSLTAPDGGAVVMGLYDWNANQTNQTLATGSGTATERSDDGNGSEFGFVMGDWVGVDSSSTAYGLSAYTGLKAHTIFVELAEATISTLISARVVDNKAETNNIGSGDFTTSSFSTVADSLLVAVVLMDHQGTIAANRVMPSSDWPTPITTGTTWTQAHYAEIAENFSTACAIYVADSPGAGSGRTFGMNSSDTQWDAYVNVIDCVIYEITGALPAEGQIGAKGKLEDANATARNPAAETVTLDSAPLASSYIIAGIAKDTNQDGGATPSTGWTETWDQDSSGSGDTGDYLSAQVMQRTGHTSTSVTWDRANTTDASNVFDFTAVAVEILTEIKAVQVESHTFSAQTSGTTTATSSWTPQNNKLYLAYIINDDSGGNVPVSVSGNGMTWEKMGRHQSYGGGSSRTLACWRAMVSTGASAGTTTVTWNAAATDMDGIIQIIEYSGTRTDGLNGGGAVAWHAQDETSSTTVTHDYLDLLVSNVGIDAITVCEAHPNTASDPSWSTGYTEVTSTDVSQASAGRMSIALDTSASPSEWPKASNVGDTTGGAIMALALYEPNSGPTLPVVRIDEVDSTAVSSAFSSSSWTPSVDKLYLAKAQVTTSTGNLMGGTRIAEVGTATNSSATTANSTSHSHTLTAGSNRVIIIYVGAETATSGVTWTVTYGGNTCTQVTMAEAVAASTSTYAGIYILLDAGLPANGSNTVSVSHTGSTTGADIYAHCTQYDNVAQSTPTGSAIETATLTTDKGWPFLETIHEGHGSGAGVVYCSTNSEADGQYSWHGRNGNQLEEADITVGGTAFSVADLFDSHPQTIAPIRTRAHIQSSNVSRAALVGVALERNGTDDASIACTGNGMTWDIVDSSHYSGSWNAEAAMIAVFRSLPASGGVSVSDDFNRANGGLGANWTTFINAPAIASNKVPSDTTGNEGEGALYTGATFAADQWVEADFITNTADNDNSIFLHVRASGDDGYYFAYPRFGGTQAQIGTIDNGAYTSQVNTSVTVGAGTNRVRFEARDVLGGVELLGYVDNVLLLRWLDTGSSYTSGDPGFLAYSSTAGYVDIDNFEAGDLDSPFNSPTTFTVNDGTSFTLDTCIMEIIEIDNPVTGANGANAVTQGSAYKHPSATSTGVVIGADDLWNPSNAADDRQFLANGSNTMHFGYAAVPVDTGVVEFRQVTEGLVHGDTDYEGHHPGDSTSLYTKLSDTDDASGHRSATAVAMGGIGAGSMPVHWGMGAKWDSADDPAVIGLSVTQARAAPLVTITETAGATASGSTLNTGSAPALPNTEGNFQIVAAVNRSGAVPTMSVSAGDSTGWVFKEVETDTANTSARHAISIGYRIVPSGASATTMQTVTSTQWACAEFSTSSGVWQDDTPWASADGNWYGTDSADLTYLRQSENRRVVVSTHSNNKINLRQSHGRNGQVGAGGGMVLGILGIRHGDAPSSDETVWFDGFTRVLEQSGVGVNTAGVEIVFKELGPNEMAAPCINIDVSDAEHTILTMSLSVIMGGLPPIPIRRFGRLVTAF